MKILAVDPGGTTGWALFTDGKLVVWDEAIDWYAIDFMLKRTLDIIVYEDFWLFPHKAAAQIGSKMLAVGVIGVLQYTATMRGILIADQAASIKNVAKKKFDTSSIHTTSEHIKDATLHGLYYIATTGTTTDKEGIAQFRWQ